MIEDIRFYGVELVAPLFCLLICAGFVNIARHGNRIFLMTFRINVFFEVKAEAFIWLQNNVETKDIIAFNISKKSFFGTVIALVGCACNLLLLFVFLAKNNRANPFQTFLAFLDFMLCFLFIACFGTLSFSVTLRIVIITAIIIILRLPGFFMIEIIDLPQCDFFASKTLSAKEMDPDLAEMYTMFDVIIQFFHLFVSFIILCLLNCVVVQKLRSSHKRARRQSSCPTVLHTNAAELEERREHKQLRCAIKTTIVIISSYLACNSVNFVLYSIEMFNSSLTQVGINNIQLV
uniref:G_PROTEIN_RECEP_F1_2 domain-containing protein n=1 Tax=Heterorhabditis bacteriophora TaxID=37862 RepID=A0A1I7WNT6_HETBA